jgi:glycerol-3-phosphate acyltransferase PlsY
MFNFVGILILAVCVVASYFAGNINPAILLGRAYGVDVRKEGSGNAGTTNVLRTLGKKAGAITFIVDVLKGFIVAFLTLYFLGGLAGAICGTAVIIGHMWPVVFGFKGGKGVATAFGVLLAANWILALALILFVIVIVAFFRMVSLGVVIAALIAIPFSAVFESWYPLWIAVIAILILLKHTGNIKRIFAGTEAKLSLRKRRGE